MSKKKEEIFSMQQEIKRIESRMESGYIPEKEGQEEIEILRRRILLKILN